MDPRTHWRLLEETKVDKQMINIDDVTKISELVKFMDEEAVRQGRTEHKSITTNGAGIKQQWDEKEKFPCAIFYLSQGANEVERLDGCPQISLEIKSMWFNESGERIERPAKMLDALAEATDEEND